MYEEEIEYLTPEKYLVDRDAILFNRLSLREAAQWSFFVGIIYLLLNYLPVDFTYRLVIGSLVLMTGYALIHQPINGLTGYEWGRVALRFSREKKLHQADPALNVAEIASRKPAFFVSVALAEQTNPTDPSPGAEAAGNPEDLAAETAEPECEHEGELINAVV